VVQAQITGSIIATSLLGLGLAALLGGLGREKQSFSPASAGLLSTLLILLMVALVLPAVFDMIQRRERRLSHARHSVLLRRAGLTGTTSGGCVGRFAACWPRLPDGRQRKTLSSIQWAYGKGY
jgi:Ca2+/H+ antiporter